MKSLNFIVLIVAFFGAINSYSQCGSVSTITSGGNGQDGIMFDIVALTSVEITNFDMNLGGGPHDFEIYYKTGTHVGFETTPGAWTLIGTANGVSGPAGVLTPIPINISVPACSGDVIAFYITSTGAGSVDYTNGTGVGNVLAADANIQILEGTGKDYAFGASFTPRSPNIAVYYNCLSMSCCAVQSITVNPSVCNAGVYSTTGSIDVFNPPSSGTLTVSDCNGNQQVINAPFSSPINYNITGQTADGAPCSITAVFSADPACTLTENYTAPGPCGCDPSWTPPVQTCSTDPPINLDALITGDTGGTWSGTGVTGNTFDPSVGTQTVTYTAPLGCTSAQAINVTTTASATWTIPTNICNSDAPFDLTPYITGTGGGTWSGTGITGTMFDPSVGTQSITYTAGTAPCDDAVTQTITVGTQATASWTPPTGLCTAASPIDLTPYITGTAGGTWSGTGITGTMFDPSVGTQSITYTAGTAPCDDAVTQTITVVSNADASWTIPTGLCIGDTPIDLSTYVTGSAGGTWTGTGVTGTMFDPSVGSQSITYSVGSAPCDDAVTQTINVASTLDSSWTVPTNICVDDAPFDMSTYITGDTGGSWSGTGITGTMFDPSVGTQSLTYTVGTGGCQSASTQTVSVDVLPNPSWTAPTLCVTSTPINLSGQVTGTAGGTWSGTGMSGSIFDPFFGTQSITYTATNGACTASSTQSITVVDPQVNITSQNVSCFGETDGSATANVTGGTGNYTYSWSPSGQTTQAANNLAAGSYQVTVTDVDGGCSVTGSVTLTEPSEIVLTMTGYDACYPDLGSAGVAASGGVSGFTYSWSPVASTAPIVQGVDSTMATVIVTDANGCTATDSVFVTIWDPPVITLTPDTTIYYGDSVQLIAGGGVSYMWSPDTDLDCNDCYNPIANPLDNMVYCVEVTDTHGCVSDECVAVTVEIVCGDIFVPSGFSPNNDGENDVLCVYSDCMDYMNFTIYNRWGEKVFESSSMNICWDGTWKGKELNSAVFVYMLEGTLINGERINQSGDITLTR
ncbi:MAG: gliding motility-associated C-terminal domain-containing protein [Crocinitomicaceae bacterium]|nr:gliding motility-associated C-terminal domain-containing protein [Crocinitomicaceae bacterium]